MGLGLKIAVGCVGTYAFVTFLLLVWFHAAVSGSWSRALADGVLEVGRLLRYVLMGALALSPLVALWWWVIQ